MNDTTKRDIIPDGDALGETTQRDEFPPQFDTSKSGRLAAPAPSMPLRNRSCSPTIISTSSTTHTSPRPSIRRRSTSRTAPTSQRNRRDRIRRLPK